MNRYDFVYFFDVTDGNPNGDPDAGNLPRVDAETGQGLVTDVCLKRKVRNYVGVVHGEQPPYEIYVKERAILNNQHERAWQVVDPKAEKEEKKKLPKEAEKARALTEFMCKNFFDIRAFGAVMTTNVNCGQVRGPIQFGFARSIDPIVSSEHAITRCAVTRQEDFDKEGKDRDMGRKFTIPYGLYCVHGFINPHLADGPNGTGFSDADLELFKKALANMFEYDRSAARGMMAPRACYAFRHESALGNARADELFDRIKCPPIGSDGKTPRNFSYYTISVNDANLPEGITIEKWV